MTKKSEYGEKYADLWDEVLTVSEIQCTKCKKVSKEYQCDGLDAAEVFFRAGWRLIKIYESEEEDDWYGEIHCPDCVKKNN
ncbi:MAG: hypothetical protein R3182_13115 [Draconibacterium sp.]|nr:hypothetical protein [Draconibacterium sp.]